MKKWVVASCLLWLVGVGFASERTYVHPETRQRARVSVKYICTLENESQWRNVVSKFFEIENDADDGCIRVKLEELSDISMWFCWEALNEYDIYDNAVYAILIEKNSSTFLSLLVMLQDNCESFYWAGVSGREE